MVGLKGWSKRTAYILLVLRHLAAVAEAQRKTTSVKDTALRLSGLSDMTLPAPLQKKFLNGSSEWKDLIFHWLERFHNQDKTY